MTRHLFILAALLALCAGCETCDADNGAGCVPPIDDEATDTSATVDEDAAVTDDMVPVAFEGRTSDCGGFDPEKAQVRMPRSCEETINWNYEQGTQRLTVRHEDIVFICGSGSGLEIEAFKDDEGYKIVEWELPHPVANCVCIYEYEITLIGVEGVMVPISVVRHLVTSSEDKGETPVWSGSLDLAQGSGTIPIKQENCP